MLFQNYLNIEGRLCNEIELKKTNNGISYCRFSICYNKPKKLSVPDEQGKEWTSVPKFFTVTAWDKLAEQTVNKIKKGDPISVIGSLDYSEWTDENNNKHSNISILATGIRKFYIDNQEQHSTNISEQRNENSVNPNIPEPEQTDFEIF